MRFNPFTPTNIVGPGMFSGRVDELKHLDRCLFQTKHGNPNHFLIHGERGIGKSSLLLYAKVMATGQVEGLESDEKYRFVTVDVEIEPTTSYEDLTRKIGSELARRLRAIEQLKSKAADFWNFITNWEVLGVKYQKAAACTDPSQLMEELCETVVAAVQRIDGCSDGIVILMDEADKATPSTDLGAWIKVFTERLTKRGCHNVCLGLSGISHVIDVLKASHESSLRILNHMLLEPLSVDERLYVIESGLRHAEHRNNKRTAIQPDAAGWIATYSEGFPHFIQQYAFSAFETDTDDDIGIDDVHIGAFKENGALDQLGVRYFEAMYRAQINSDEYRRVLHAIAESNEKYVSKQKIREDTGLKETTLGNALQSLKNKQIILAHPEKQGLYRLPNDSFAVWIRAQIDREAQADKDAKWKKF